MKKIKNIKVSDLIFKSERINRGDLGVLAENIKTYGLQHPLLIKSCGDNGKFEIVDGRRRFSACKLLDMSEIPCIVLTAEEINEDLPLILNTQRLNFNAVELYQLAVKYVRDELKGDPLALPPEKIKAVAAKLNLDIHATCRILNIGRLSKDVRDFIASGKLPIRLALLVLRISNKKDQKKFCRLCIEERPSMREALEMISWRVKQAPDRDIFDALFDTEECQKCRHRGHRDRSLFEEPVEGDDENFADSCWNIKCFEQKTEDAWKQMIKEAKEKLGLTEITKLAKTFNSVKFNDVTAVSPEKCKKCKQVKAAPYDRKIAVCCPVTCVNIKQIKQSSGREAKPKKKDPAKFTKEDKIQVLEERFAVAARKAMMKHFIEIKTDKRICNGEYKFSSFTKGKTPKDYRRILFFVGTDARTNPFLTAGDFNQEEKIIAALDLRSLAKRNLRTAVSHLASYDRSGITPEQIDKAIALLYGIDNWCGDHYDDIHAKLSKRSKSFLKDIQPWKPSWSRKKKKK